MNRNKAIALYLLGTLGQIWMICIIVFILRNLGMVVDYTTPIGMVAIGIGGVSSALWGTVIAIRYKSCFRRRNISFINSTSRINRKSIFYIFICR